VHWHEPHFRVPYLWEDTHPKTQGLATFLGVGTQFDTTVLLGLLQTRVVQSSQSLFRCRNLLRSLSVHHHGSSTSGSGSSARKSIALPVETAQPRTREWQVTTGRSLNAVSIDPVDSQDSDVTPGLTNSTSDSDDSVAPADRHVMALGLLIPTAD
jgi:hypothetical protein